MNLPKVDYPTFDVDLSIGKIKYRPFLVKEQKLLLMAHDSKNIDSIMEATKQVIQNCVLVPNDFDVTKLPIVDMSKLFLHLRARSMGEHMKIYYKCQNDFEGNVCNMIIEASVNLLEVKEVGGNANPKIMITDDIGVKMR